MVTANSSGETHFDQSSWWWVVGSGPLPPPPSPPRLSREWQNLLVQLTSSQVKMKRSLVKRGYSNPIWCVLESGQLYNTSCVT